MVLFMDLTQLTTADFNKLEKLIEKKERLLGQIKEIDQTLASPTLSKPALKAKPEEKSTATKTVPQAKGGRQNNLTELIVTELKAAGKKGIHIKELAENLGTKRGNINAWIYSTGKKVRELNKLGKGMFGWNK